MSSQSEGIALHHAPDNRGYRLIELPPELQSLLESDTAPVLTLESSDTSAILKSPTKTYALRQKNTSNSMVILAPHSLQEGEGMGEPGVAAIATIHETVELDATIDKPDAGANGPTKAAGGKGKWHERFGRGR